MGLHRDDSMKPGSAGQEAGGSSDLSKDLTAAPPLPGAGSRGRPASIASGTTLDHFEVLELLGAGGFGEVYRARDTRLGRMVAIKVLPEDFARDAERRERLRREAMAASALNHPNICTVHDLIEANGRHLIVMELVEGKTLHAVLANGPLPAGEAVSIALQIIDALAEAHRAGILHRDIKSGNIALTPRGQAKILDFGLAKLVGPSRESEGSTLEKLTAEGTAIGTLGYVSPEQLLGRPLDGRGDLFSFGVVLYEMVTGRLPFPGSTQVAVADAILHAEPHDFGDSPVPEKLKEMIRKLLQKDPARRYASAEEVGAELKALEAPFVPLRSSGVSRSIWLASVGAAAVAIIVIGWLLHRSSRERWVRETTAEIKRLLDADEFSKAAALAKKARPDSPKDPTFEKFWVRATNEASVDSVPPGAEVSIRPYRGAADAWESLGKTPLTGIRIARNDYVWRIASPGFAAQYCVHPEYFSVMVRLVPEGSVPAGMIPVLGFPDTSGVDGLRTFPKVRLDDFLIDRTEVTNEEYKTFVDAGGYRKRDSWKEPFVKDGRTIPWEEALLRFRDTTGRPGPSTWEVGSYPKGLGKHPVAGICWYEAAAYAEFAGKSLPTVYHWTWAADTWLPMLIVSGSNFRGAGTVPVASGSATSGWGTTDMAGNVKEWCWNESVGAKRFILGGGFGEPTYMFIEKDAMSPWDRRPNYGFRCVKLSSPPPPAATARLESTTRDFLKEKPVSDEVFNAFKGLYAYDRGKLNAKVEETKTTEDWTWEKVTFDAAYGGERVIAHLFLPRNAVPPFQTVIYFPGSEALYFEKFDDSTFSLEDVGFFPETGRALLFPVYKSTFERRDSLKSDVPDQTANWRDHMVAWSKDLGRSLDYLKTRTDIDSTRIAYVGFSWGGFVAPVLLGVEDRFRVAIVLSGGLMFQRALPEAEPINFVTRVKTPVLMLNGRYDSGFPLESAQLPLFRLLGTPEKDKRHVIYDEGHSPPRKEFVRDSLDWLDKYLGPVKR